MRLDHLLSKEQARAEMPELHPKVDRERKRRRGIGSAGSPVGSSQRLQSMTDMRVQTRESERAKRGLNKETHSVTEAVEELRKSVLYRFQGLRNRTLTWKRSKPDERKAPDERKVLDKKRQRNDLKAAP